MTVQQSLKTALQERVSPVARENGFKGSAPNWRRVTPLGDWAIVNIQSSSWNTPERGRCVVNISVAPEPWLRWQAARLPRGLPKAIPESLGLYRDRLHPRGTPTGLDGWWEITDSTSALAAADDIVDQLGRAGWATLDRLLNRSEMLAQVRAGSLGFMKRAHFEVVFAMAEALLLMDDQASQALEDQLALAREHVTPLQKDNAERFETWVRAQSKRTR